MSQMLKLKIDVTKFDKTAFFVGQKGTYAKVTVFVNDEEDQYGQFGTVKQDIGKERNDAGERDKIIGNVTRVSNKQGNGNGIANQMRPPMQQATPVRGASNNYQQDDSDSIPF